MDCLQFTPWIINGKHIPSAEQHNSAIYANLTIETSPTHQEAPTHTRGKQLRHASAPFVGVVDEKFLDKVHAVFGHVRQHARDARPRALSERGEVDVARVLPELLQQLHESVSAWENEHAENDPSHKQREHSENKEGGGTEYRANADK